ncbi:polyprenol phosphomannose-dependent alpha 1,6 mannosyltransferase MptB [Pseudonocardia sp. CA-107938]|uniref:polyprenol phosphomannose-dependent alpha 1,6 mannosyltransferase MptB n=1 Tax=Pseudonocardia sp. CA-107938 TaxID=3240021 RepID=UPI003D8A78EA
MALDVVAVQQRRPDPTRAARRTGLAGSLAAAAGAFGAGALPAGPVPGLLSTVALALVYAGALLMVIGWWDATQLVRSGEVPAGAALRLVGVWAAPLALAPPLFSRDVYAALAQGTMAARGLDPAVWSPAAALGPDAPSVLAVSQLWRAAPSPYGPVASLVQQAVAALTGTDPVAGVLVHRAVALGGLAAIIWALPRLAARHGVDPGRAIVLGAAHPLVLFHLVSGVHHDALMLGLVLAGLELAARAGPLRVAGVVLIALAGMVKLPALLVLGFVAAQEAGKRGGRVRDVVVTGASTAAVAGTVAAGAAGLFAWQVGGTGWTWIGALDVPATVVTWLSPPSMIGFGAAHLTGAPLDGVLAVTRGTALVVAAVVLAGLLLATVAGRLDALSGTAVGFGVVIVCGPVVQPWYLLWALLPLAAAGRWPRWTPRLLAGAAVVALLDVPPGDWWEFTAMHPLVAVPVAAAVVLLVRPGLLSPAPGTPPPWCASGSTRGRSSAS